MMSDAGEAGRAGGVLVPAVPAQQVEQRQECGGNGQMADMSQDQFADKANG
jgi:hypothetical protein